MLGDSSIASQTQKSQRIVLRWLLDPMGKWHAYWEQMKSMMPYGITGLERVKSDICTSGNEDSLTLNATYVLLRNKRMFQRNVQTAESRIWYSSDIRDFDLPLSPIWIPPFRTFVAGSDQSGWDHEYGESASTAVLMLRKSLSAHSSSALH